MFKWRLGVATAATINYQELRGIERSTKKQNLDFEGSRADDGHIPL